MNREATPAAVALVISTALLVMSEVMHPGTMPVPAAIAAVLLVGQIAAFVIVGGMWWIASVAGALGVLGWWGFFPYHPIIAGWLLLSLWFLPRALLMKTRSQSIAHLFVATALSLGAAVVFGKFLSEDLLRHIASAVFAGAMMAVPILSFRARHPRTLAFEWAHAQLPAPADGLLATLVDRLDAGEVSVRDAAVRKAWKAVERCIEESPKDDQALEEAVRALHEALGSPEEQPKRDVGGQTREESAQSASADTEMEEAPSDSDSASPSPAPEDGTPGSPTEATVPGGPVDLPSRTGESEP